MKYKIVRFDSDEDLQTWLNDFQNKWEPISIAGTNHSICCLVRRLTK